MFGTTVKNPVHRPGRSAFTQCRMCGKWYTSLGISRHWDKCRAQQIMKLITPKK